MCVNGPCPQQAEYTPTPPTKSGCSFSTRSTACKITSASCTSTRRSWLRSSIAPLPSLSTNTSDASPYMWRLRFARPSVLPPVSLYGGERHERDDAEVAHRLRRLIDLRGEFVDARLVRRDDVGNDRLARRADGELQFAALAKNGVVDVRSRWRVAGERSRDLLRRCGWG